MSKPAPGEVVQPVCQFGHEGVGCGAGGFCGEQLPPLPICLGSRVCELLVELLSDDSSVSQRTGEMHRRSSASNDNQRGIDANCPARARTRSTPPR